MSRGGFKRSPQILFLIVRNLTKNKSSVISALIEIQVVRNPTSKKGEHSCCSQVWLLRKENCQTKAIMLLIYSAVTSCIFQNVRFEWGSQGARIRRKHISSLQCSAGGSQNSFLRVPNSCFPQALLVAWEGKTQTRHRLQFPSFRYMHRKSLGERVKDF